MSRRVYLETMGCQMNMLDSELVMGQLRALGYVSTDDYTQADLVLLNTCSVREQAENKALSRLGALRKPKQARPDMIVGVMSSDDEGRLGLLISAVIVDAYRMGLLAGSAVSIEHFVDLVTRAGRK